MFKSLWYVFLFFGDFLPSSREQTERHIAVLFAPNDVFRWRLLSINIEVSNFPTLNPQNTIFGCISGILQAKTRILFGVISLERIKLLTKNLAHVFAWTSETERNNFFFKFGMAGVTWLPKFLGYPLISQERVKEILWVDMSAFVKFRLDRPSRLAGHTEQTDRQTNISPFIRPI